ncbi:hypothetical protein TrCOL_g13592 [Triparma columacea]|uniref:Uncharacterized protein n=1 Tax=Triparma columacea TaxID=722753 RepID=A0A9W7GHW1_9STRA|nr:hypothetical protein TrCOL_g13592 [Triparma columacea]
MPPKKAKVDPEAEPEVPLDDNGNPVDEIAIDNVNETISEELITSLTEEALEALHQERISEITLPFAASLSLNNILRVTAWSNLGRDLGSKDSADKDSQLWSIEAEPTACRIDTWARGSVPTKAKKKAEAFASVEHMKGSISPGTMSVNSKSSRGKFSHRTGSRGGSRGGRRPRGMSPTEFTPVVVSIDLDQDDGMADGKLRGVKSDAGTLMDGNGQGDAELLKALKADKAKKMEEIRKQKEKEMAENAERVAHEALMKQLSGKEYTIDDDGSVIMVDVPDAKALPPATGFKVDSSIFDVQEDSSPGSRMTPNSKRGKRGKKKPGSSHKKKRTDADYFTVSSTAQPALISTMTISAGVSLKEGGRGKSGPEVTGGPGKMSRREYDDRKRREEESYYASIGGSTYAGDSIDLDSQTVSTNESLTLDGTESALSPRPESEPKVFLGEVDSLSGAKKAKKKAETPGDYQESPHDKLTKDPNWGKPTLGNDPSPIRLAKKPNPKQVEIVSQFSGGPNAKNRRDRYQPCAMLPNKDRRHLPAPPLGHATGHGMEATIASGTKSVDFDDAFSVGSQRSVHSKVSRSKGSTSGMFPPIVQAEGDNNELSLSESVASKKAGWQKNRQVSILGTKGGGVIKDGNAALKREIIS